MPRQMQGRGRGRSRRSNNSFGNHYRQVARRTRLNPADPNNPQQQVPLTSGNFNPGGHQPHDEQLGDHDAGHHDWGGDDGGAWAQPEPPEPDNGHGQVVAVLPGGSEVHFALNTTWDRTQRIDEQHFCFVGLAEVSFADASVVVGWCTKPGCQGAACHASHVLSGSGSRFQQVASHNFFQGSAVICPTAQGLLTSWGGWNSLSLRDLRAVSEQALPVAVRTADFQLAGRLPAKAVQTDLARFGTYAALLQHTNSRAWFCTECSDSHKCEHMRAAVPGSNVEAGLSPEAFERKLNREFDTGTGERRLKCLSREALKQNLADDRTLAHLLSSRAPVPAQCSMPAGSLSKACSGCQLVNWGAASWQDSDVILQGALVATSFEHRSCQTAGCSGELYVDGKEHGVLRETKELAFSLQLLYDWAARVSTGSPDTWTQAWRIAIMQISGLSLARSRQLWDRKKLFVAATLDFVQLQGIDFAAGFRCDCYQDGVLLDATAMAFKKGMALVAHTWTQPHPDQGVKGVAFKERVFLVRAGLRRLLAAFAAGSPGLSQEDMETLETDLGQYEGARGAALVAFLHAGIEAEEHWHARPVDRELLSCLASTAPVAQLMRPAVFHLIELLLEGSQLAFQQERQLQETCPVLYTYVASFERGQLPEPVHALLTQIAQVARAAAHAPAERWLGAGAQPAQAPGAPQPPPLERPPTLWTRNETMLRTCSYSGLGTEPWQQTEHGGSDVFRQPRGYAADHAAGSAQEDCTKHQKSTLGLLPGIMLYWCMTCWQCVFFHVMGSAESPKTVFDVLYSRFPSLPKRICMDNACNLHNYCIKREPEYFKDVHWYIDEAHFRGHTRCCPAYSTGKYEAITNSSLAEQKNSRLRRLDHHASYMNQTTFMWYMQYYVYQLNAQQKLSNAGQDFTKRVRRNV